MRNCVLLATIVGTFAFAACSSGSSGTTGDGSDGGPGGGDASADGSGPRSGSGGSNDSGAAHDGGDGVDSGGTQDSGSPVSDAASGDSATLADSGAASDSASGDSGASPDGGEKAVDWATTFQPGGATSDTGQTVAFTGTGTILAGAISNTMNTFDLGLFKEGPLPSGGTLQTGFLPIVPLSSTALVPRVLPGPNGVTFVAYSFTGTLQYGSTSIPAAGSGQSIALLELDTTGALSTFSVFGDTGSSNAKVEALTAGPGGAIAVVGGFTGTLPLSSKLTLNSAGKDDGFLAAFSVTSSGFTPMAAQSFGGTEEDFAYAVAYDATANVVDIGGTIASPNVTFPSLSGNGQAWTFPSAEPDGGVDYGAFVVQYDTTAGGNGNVLWAKVASTAQSGSNCDLRSLAPLNGGGVAAGGRFSGSIAFPGGQTLQANGAPSAFVWTLGDTGALEFVHQLSVQGSSTTASVINSVAVDSSNDIVVGGSFSGTADFGTLLVCPTQAGFVYKMSPTGAPLWVQAFADNSADTINAVAVDPSSGTIAAMGTVSGTTLIATSSGNASFNTNGNPEALVLEITP